MAQEETAGGGTIGRNPSFGVINPSGINPETAMRSIQEDTMQRRALAQEAQENEKTRAFQADQNNLQRMAEESQFSRSHQLAMERERAERFNADRSFKLSQDDFEFRKKMEEYSARRSILEERNKVLDQQRQSRYNQGLLENQAAEDAELVKNQEEARLLDERMATLSALHQLIGANSPEEQAEIIETLMQEGIAETFGLNSMITALEDAREKIDQAFTPREDDLSFVTEMFVPGDAEARMRSKVAGDRGVEQASKILAETLLPYVVGNATSSGGAAAGLPPSEDVKAKLEGLFKNLFAVQNIRMNSVPGSDRNYASEIAQSRDAATFLYQKLEQMGVNVSMLDMAVFSLSKMTGGAASADLISKIASGQALEQAGVSPSGTASPVTNQKMIQGALNSFGSLVDENGNRIAKNFGGTGVKVFWKKDPSTGKMSGFSTSDINKKVAELLVRLNSGTQTAMDPRALLDEMVSDPQGGRFADVLGGLPEPIVNQLKRWAQNERLQLNTYIQANAEQFRDLIGPDGNLNISMSQLKKLREMVPTEAKTKAEFSQRDVDLRRGMLPSAQNEQLLELQRQEDLLDYIFNRR